MKASPTRFKFVLGHFGEIGISIALTYPERRDRVKTIPSAARLKKLDNAKYGSIACGLGTVDAIVANEKGGNLPDGPDGRIRERISSTLENEVNPPEIRARMFRSMIFFCGGSGPRYDDFFNTVERRSNPPEKFEEASCGYLRLAEIRYARSFAKSGI